MKINAAFLEYLVLVLYPCKPTRIGGRRLNTLMMFCSTAWRGVLRGIGKKSVLAMTPFLPPPFTRKKHIVDKYDK
jgi:hypothetical protein